MAEGDRQYWLNAYYESGDTLQQEPLSPKERGDAAIKHARACSALGKTRWAVKMWLLILESDKVDDIAKARAQYRLGLHFEEKKDWRDSIDHYQHYVSRFRKLTESGQSSFDMVQEHGDVIAFHIGELYEHRLRDVNSAERAYQAAVDHARQQDSIQFRHLQDGLAKFFMRQERWDEALAVWRLLLAHEKQKGELRIDFTAQYSLQAIKCCLALSDTDSALSVYRDALAVVGEVTEIDKPYIEEAQGLLMDQGIVVDKNAQPEH